MKRLAQWLWRAGGEARRQPSRGQGAPSDFAARRRRARARLGLLAALLARLYAGLLVATLAARGSPAARVSPLALAVAYLPLLAVPLPAALALAVARRERGLLVALAAAGVLLARVYGGRFRPRRPLRSSGRALRVLTLNLLADADNVERVVALLRATQPDCFAAQELSPAGCARLSRALAAAYPFAITRPDRGQRGLGIWSQHPVREQAVVRTASGEPLALLAEVASPLGRLYLGTVHARAADFGLRSAGLWLYSARRRDAEIARVLQAVRQLPSPLVLAGDFNMADQSVAYRDVTRWLDDAFVARGFGLGHTFPLPVGASAQGSWWPRPLLRLDYVFHSRDLRALEARVLDAVGSDHLPVLVALERRPALPLPRPRPALRSAELRREPARRRTRHG